MTQEEKSILLKDLCARLPYGVKGIITYDESNTIFTIEGIDNNVLHLSDVEECYVEDFKPYLRPMSSMTEEEKKYIISLKYQPSAFEYMNIIICSQEVIKWLNANHFDYRGLIEKGLALKAPEGMYK